MWTPRGIMRGGSCKTSIRWLSVYWSPAWPPPLRETLLRSCMTPLVWPRWGPAWSFSCDLGEVLHAPPPSCALLGEVLHDPSCVTWVRSLMSPLVWPSWGPAWPPSCDLGEVVWAPVGEQLLQREIHRNITHGRTTRPTLHPYPSTSFPYCLLGVQPTYLYLFGKCNFPMKHNVRLSICRSVCLSVCWSVQKKLSEYFRCQNFR